jgi:hypothetical protein
LVLTKPGIVADDAKGIYSACSRGKRGCIVVADFDRSANPASGKCPSRDFATTVMTSKDVLPRTEFWSRFPKYDEGGFANALVVDPESCIHYNDKDDKVWFF